MSSTINIVKSWTVMKNAVFMGLTSSVLKVLKKGTAQKNHKTFLLFNFCSLRYGTVHL